MLFILFGSVGSALKMATEGADSSKDNNNQGDGTTENKADIPIQKVSPLLTIFLCYFGLTLLNFFSDFIFLSFVYLSLITMTLLCEVCSCMTTNWFCSLFIFGFWQ